MKYPEDCFECEPTFASNKNLSFPNYKFCDGEQDCKDNRDEYHCKRNYDISDIKSHTMNIKVYKI